MTTQEMIKTTGVWDVKRKIKIPALTHISDAETIEELLLRLPGVQRVIVNTKKKHVVVCHDVTKTDFQRILSTLDDVGYPPLDNRWCRLKKRLYLFLDTNAKDNANAPVRPCCNKPPK